MDSMMEFAADGQGEVSTTTISDGRRNGRPVSAPAVANAGAFVAVNTSTALSSMISVSGNAVTYEIQDTGGNSGSGYFTVNGAPQGANQIISVSASDIGNVYYVGGLGSSSESLMVRAFDGTSWSDWTSWQQNTGVGGGNGGTPPTVNATTGSVGVNASTAASSFFSTTSAGGSDITNYEFWDSTDSAGTGYFAVNGVAQGANQAISVSVSDLSTVNFVGGTSSGTDQVWVRAFNGLGWSDWTGFSVNTGVGSGGGGGSPPTVSAGTGSVDVNGSVAASGLFSVSDPNGNTITNYEFWDSSDAAGTGYFTVGGTAQGANQTISVSAGELGNTKFVGGTSSGSDTVWVRAYNGSDWSEWASWTMNTGVGSGGGGGTPPTVSAGTGSVDVNGSVAASGLFSASDPNGKSITNYEFWDSTDAAGTGYFTVNGTAQGANQTISVSAGDLANTRFVGGTGSGNDTVWVRVYNGSDWSEWASWNMTTGVGSGTGGTPPTVSASTGSVSANASTSASSFFSVSDPNGASITAYEFWDSNDSTGSGYFSVNGTGQGANQTISVSASQLSNVSFVGGTSPTSDQVWVRAFNGTTWSEWKDWTMTTGEAVVTNHGPVVSTAATTTAMSPDLVFNNGSYSNGNYTTSILTSGFFSVHDQEGNPQTAYQVIDNTGDSTSGSFYMDGATLSANTVHEISVADVGRLHFQPGSTGSDSISIRASDGTDWGDWTTFTIQYRNPIVRPEITSVSAGSTVALSSLFSFDSSADTSSITGYNLGFNSFSSGSLTLDGQNLSWGTLVSAADFGNVMYHAGTSGYDSVAITVRDNYSGNWLADGPSSQILVLGVGASSMAAAGSDRPSLIAPPQSASPFLAAIS